MTPDFLNDTELRFPNCIIVSASAGSGKTHALTLKLLQLLLSRRIPNNHLNNILAMTFTKNAAAEMRQRVLEYLKKAYHGNHEILARLHALVSMDEKQLRIRCGELIETILQDYSSFQVQTIDSFMARVFRASALEFGFSPTLEIKINSRLLLDAAFEQFTRDLSTDPSKKLLLEQLTEILVESQSTSSRYIWNPFQKLSNEVRNLYNTLLAQSKELLPYSNDTRPLNVIRKEILDTFHALETMVHESGLEVTKNFETVIKIASREDVDDLIGRNSLYAIPVKQSGKAKETAEKWNIQFTLLQDRLYALSTEYAVQQAKNYYRPYVEAHRLLSITINQIMHRDNQASLDDISRALLSYISEEIVPQVYFYLGETISHYLIDEFQDTAPVQWETMKPLLAEALSKNGSLFVVGDTKQSIYAFRHADWRIMKNMKESVVFPSALPNVYELGINFRSFERILDFNKKVFHTIVPSVMEGEAPKASGLSQFIQEVKENNRTKGYVEVVSFEKEEEREPACSKILDIVADCRKRGYRYGDITILTQKNEYVISASGWLNGASVPFVSHSSLDIRGRKITGDILALLKFLDSPIDDLAFATFLMSEIFHRMLSKSNLSISNEQIHLFLVECNRKQRTTLYASFRIQYRDIWKQYFEELFNVVGYMPMYDLVSDIYQRFQLFELTPEEESTLAKFLEVVKNFEESGRNNIKDFLAFAEENEDDSEWNISAPQGADAVSIMTIHKSKGLDNRVVIVFLVDSKRRPDNLFIEENDEGVRLVRITKKNAEYDPEFQRLYNQRRFEQEVDDLNKLYVAFTRAKEEMYIISIKNAATDEPSKFLPLTGYEPSKKPDVEKQDIPIERTTALYHSTSYLPASSLSSEKLNLYERQRGEIIHDILSCIEYAEADIEKQIAATIEEITEGRKELRDISYIPSLILEFLRMPEIKPFFTPVEKRTVMNEQEFVNPEGRLFRMDRVVVDAASVTVIDYKTGDDKDIYDDQIHGYRIILQNIFPDRTIHGILAFVDRKKVRVVE